MSELAEVISGEFEEALEVKNPKSLQRGIFLLLSSTVPREEYNIEHNNIKSSIVTLNNNVELIALRMEEGFKRMDQRFEAVDKRFETLQANMDQRFEAVDKRFESMQVNMNQRFEASQQQIDKHIESMDKRFNRQTAMMSIGFLVITTLITIYRFLG